MKTGAGLVAAVVLGSCILTLHVPGVRADAPADINVAIPTNVTVTVGQTMVVFIGRPSSTSPVNCAPGTPHPQAVVAIDPQGGHASQITGVLAHHDHEIPNGTRYRINGGPSPCHADLRLYVGTLE